MFKVKVEGEYVVSGKLKELKYYEAEFDLEEGEESMARAIIQNGLINDYMRKNVEGYGRWAYKNDFIRFLTYALASNDETMDHLEILYETKSLNNEQTYNEIHAKIEMLGKKINRSLAAVSSGHKSEKWSSIQNLESSIKYLVRKEYNGIFWSCFTNNHRYW